MAVFQTLLHHSITSSHCMFSISSSSSVSSHISVNPSIFCCSSPSPVTLVNRNVERKVLERNEIRLGLPSKGRMASDTLNLLKDCQLSVRQVNPRQYVAEIPLLSNLEVWFQRPKDVVRKLLSGDLDLGIVGLDTLSEYGQGNEDLVLVHDALDYGDCRLSIAIPKYGIFENINSLSELAQMPQWTYAKPLRVATGFTYLGPKFMKENGLKHVTFSTADGALEAAPAMGIADAILDLVSSGTTLRENNLKEIKGGVVLESQAVLVASKKSLIQREGVLDITHEIIERLEAHLRAVGQFMVTANIRGSSEEEVADRILSQTSLSGLQVRIAEKDWYKTTFILPMGQYEWGETVAKGAIGVDDLVAFTRKDVQVEVLEVSSFINACRKICRNSWSDRAEIEMKICRNS
ncbi:hypothetical protein HHK36_004420 [Tetracentron sinense]|uniref:ATP phosphoribosyltransferase n=1 Tax=Tetracentron sinense TaxID=13715 RepID=A0A834ZZX8_TETSI|nr:hypothetical protein HHK36_004420 [Tetracentron sinense]